jgi:hypothetical protein
LGLNYSYDITRSYADDEFTDTKRQSVLFNGDLNVLKYWKIGFSSGYDLVAEDWTPTSLNLYWDLHCWEFNFNIIPSACARASVPDQREGQHPSRPEVRATQAVRQHDNNLLY